MVKTILCSAIEGDEEYASNIGKWFDTESVNHIVDYDADVWGEECDGTVKLLAKFRRNCLEHREVMVGWECFRNAAQQTRGRAAAAGPIDVSGAYFQNRKTTNVDGYKAQYYRENGTVSKMKIQNPVASGTVGFFERTTFLRLPCRLTAYTRLNMERFKRGITFLEAIDGQFKKLIPEKYEAQHRAASARPEYQIGRTAFSTLTVNMNFRTALHKDSGDYDEGFGNLTVIEYGKYRGGYTLFPRFRIGFDVRSGDFLAMNVHEYHCNSKIWTTEEDDEWNATLPDIRETRSKADIRDTVGANERYGRLTFVCYLRKKLATCDHEATKKYYEKIKFNDEYDVSNGISGQATDGTESNECDGAEVHTSVNKT